MNIVRSWREQRILMKRRFAELTDEDFNEEKHDRETIMKKLQVKLNKTEQELKAVFAELQLY